MARKALDIETRMKRKENKILQLKKELDAEQEEYKQLEQEYKEEQRRKLFEAFEHSRHSYEEIMEFLNGKADV